MTLPLTTLQQVGGTEHCLAVARYILPYVAIFHTGGFLQ